MKKYLLISLNLFAGILLAQTTFNHENYQLVWSDEFDVDGLPNTNNWRYETGYSIRNNEAQNYTANRLENARVENGHLIIEARKDNYQNHEISSASLVSWGKVVHQYGRFECRAKIDIRSGSWPAFWTLGESGEWPSNGEIDIMEYYKGKLLGNAAWGTETRWSGKWDSQTIPISSFPSGWEDEFHIFMMEWTPDYIRLYVDDILINAVDLSQTFNGSLGEYKNPFRQPHYLILNQAIGGNNGGDYSNTQFPIKYEIDYVRIFQLGNGDLDCNWDKNGTAYLDDCSNCVGGNTNKNECVLSCNGNQVKNPGFEDNGLTNWTGWGTRNATTNSNEGTYAVAVGNGAAEQVVPVLPNTTYNLRVNVRKSGGGAAFIGVKEYGMAELSLRIDNNVWQEKTLTFRTGNSSTARIYYYNPEGGTAYADNFYLEQKGCELITNIKNNELDSQLTVYPVPAKEYVDVILSKTTNDLGNIQLINLKGEVMYESSIDSQTRINLEPFAAGIYSLKVTTNKNTLVKKIVKE